MFKMNPELCEYNNDYKKTRSIYDSRLVINAALHSHTREYSHSWMEQKPRWWNMRSTGRK